MGGDYPPYSQKWGGGRVPPVPPVAEPLDEKHVPSVLENIRWFKSYGTLNSSDIHVATEMPAAPFLCICPLFSVEKRAHRDLLPR